MRNVRFIGLDVHATTITVAVAESAGEVRSLGTIANRPEAVRRLVRKLGPADELRVCYEAGPTGYGLYWQLLGLGVHCDVVAPSLVPVKAGDRVKTDRRDALKLARCYRAGDLTPVWVPDAEQGTAPRPRPGTRSGEEGPTPGAPSAGQVPATPGPTPPRPPEGGVDGQAPRLDPGSPLRVAAAPGGVDGLPARGRARRGPHRRVERHHPRGGSHRAVPDALRSSRRCRRCAASQPSRRPPSWRKSASSPASRTHASSWGTRGWSPANTRAGRGAGRAASRRRGTPTCDASWWKPRGRTASGRPSVAPCAPARQASTLAVTEIAWRAQKRLHHRYRMLAATGKNHNQVITAVGRELLGFIWDIARTVERRVPVRATA